MAASPSPHTCYDEIAMGHPDPAGMDAVIEAYKAGIDRTLLRASLKLTPAERIERLSDLYDFSVSLRRAGREARLQSVAPSAKGP